VNSITRTRGGDQLGRSRSPLPICLLSLTLFAVIVGSAWPISARSLDPACEGTHPYRPHHTHHHGISICHERSRRVHQFGRRPCHALCGHFVRNPRDWVGVEITDRSDTTLSGACRSG